MSIFKKRGLCFIGSFCLSVVLALINQPFFLSFLNTWSVLGLLMLLFGILTYFSSRGYYDSLHFTLNRIRHSFQKSNQPLESYAQFHQLRQNKKSNCKPIMMPVGAVITVLCLILSFWIWPMI